MELAESGGEATTEAVRSAFGRLSTEIHNRKVETNMADDPRKKKADSKRQSQQKHEVVYQRRKTKAPARMKKG